MIELLYWDGLKLLIKIDYFKVVLCCLFWFKICDYCLDENRIIALFDLGGSPFWIVGLKCLILNWCVDEFAYLTQTSNFYTQDLFQSIFLTGMQHQITQQHIKAQQRMNYLAQLFLWWFTQSQSYIQFTRTTWAWFPLYSKVLQITHQDYTFEQRTT